MKFFFVSTMQGSPWGGSEELWSQAATKLKRLGHDVRAAVFYRPQMSAKHAELIRNGVDLETYPSYLAGPARQVWNRYTLATRRSYFQLKRFNPDLVIISQGDISSGFDWVRVCRNAGIPYVMILQCNSEFWWFDERAAGDAIASYTQARKVFCVSQANLNLLRLQLGDPLLNGEVVWNPCNVAPQQALSWPDEATVWRLACVGRLDPAPKGQDLLLQALARPEWRERSVEVNLYGAGPCKQTLRRLAEMLRLTNVRFRGHVNDIQTIWEHNHILLLPSRYEGLPLALVEAMWCGRPAVVTDVGGNAEVCIDGETGFVAPAATAASFATSLERAWERREEWQRLAQAARARIETVMPKDPVALFCERLMASVTTGSAKAAVV